MHSRCTWIRWRRKNINVKKWKLHSQLTGLGIILKSAPRNMILCLFTETKWQTFCGIPGLYSTSGALLPWNVMLLLLLVLGKCSYALGQQPSWCVTPYFWQISHASPLCMREYLSERGLLSCRILSVAESAVEIPYIFILPPSLWKDKVTAKIQNILEYLSVLYLRCYWSLCNWTWCVDVLLLISSILTKCKQSGHNVDWQQHCDCILTITL